MNNNINNNNSDNLKKQSFINKLIIDEDISNLKSIVKLNKKSISHNEIVYIKSPNKSLKEIEEYCFYLKDLPKTVKSCIFNQFSCLFIHLFQIEFNNNIIVNNKGISTHINNKNGRSSINNSTNKIKDLDGFLDCTDLKKSLFTIHENLLSLLQKNSFYWYEPILKWSLGCLTILIKLFNILKSNNNIKNKNKNKQKKDKCPNYSDSNKNISTIVKERLEYYSFKSLLSIVLHLAREESIENFLKASSTKEFLDNSLKSKTTTEYELDHKETNNSQKFIHNIKLFLILISKDNSFLKIALPSILDNLTSFSIEDFDNNSKNINTNNSNNDINFSNNSQIEEDLKIIKTIIEDILLSPNEIIAFNSKRILLALYFSCYSPKISSNPSIKTIAPNKKRFEISIKLFELLIEKLEKQLVLKSYSPSINLELNNNNNDNFYNEFINNLNHPQNITFYLNQIEFIDPSSSSTLKPESIKKNNLLLKLISVIGVNSIKSSIVILTYLLTELKSPIEYFYLFAETFQAVNSNTINYFINDIFKSIDSYIESDLLLLLNNLLILVKKSPITTTINNHTNGNQNHNLILLKIHKKILKSTRNNWSKLLNLINHPNTIYSHKNIPLEILYHSFNNIYKNTEYQIPSPKQQVEKKNKNHNKSDQIFETRILIEKILFFIIKNLRNLQHNNTHDKELKRLKKFEEYKNFYLLLCEESFYFTITIDVVLDNLFSTKTDMIIKVPALCPLSSANTIPPPTFPDNSPPDINNNDENNNMNIINNNIINKKKNKIRHEEEEEEDIYFNQIIDPSLPLSQPLVISSLQPTLFESNYERKYYHYKFNDMNNPSHISFTNQPSKKKKLDSANELFNDRAQNDTNMDGTENNKEISPATSNSTSSSDVFINSFQSLNFILLNNENDLMSFINQLLNVTGPSSSDQRECKLKILTDQFLLRVVPNHLEPTYENYQEILPKQSNFERDIYIRNLFQQNPFLYRILEIISTDARQLVRCLEVLKSLLVNEISYWYQYKNYGDNPLKSNHYLSTIQLVQILINSQFIVHPLNLSLELFDIIKSEEISYILTSIWNFIKDYKPEQSQYQLNPDSKKLQRDFSYDATPYSLTLKSIFHNHIKELCYHYSRFFPKKY
ncbi:hypothetical protein DICPUDRAFT_96433 [Dictyostelium purpureum]|uniref:Integrator complex subunit 5 C-terminal domain-containing protein n=1 Tax=Dictyostelium purpureum TaxID=5786 RepID=F0Z891_DICPU|nr:uncharacterized protein DICPUDRAFT_96433 [Dictyostelium purpureum]EGC39853.1 hypothetical protein DICPUDRAFT_96433 [Dictyostelium purpureum]|eukprot:XP_003283604.1 hypothetical protein DICPUDRAFT_96433 [Dictyostelium purpureum]